MARALIAKSNYNNIGTIWTNNRTGIVLVKENGTEYYVSGVRYDSSANIIYSVRAYNADKTNILRDGSSYPIDIVVEENDSLYEEVV